MNQRDATGSANMKTILSNCDAKRDHNYRLGADSFTITNAEYAALREIALSSETADRGWIWSLEEPEVSGWRWIATWDVNKLEMGVIRFTVGDSLPKHVTCWRYLEAPK